MMSKWVVIGIATVLFSATMICSNLQPAHAQDKNGDCGGVSTKDMGPIVTVMGNPPPPTDVEGQLTGGTDEDGNIIILRQGTTVAVTVSATAQGTSAESNRPNKIFQISLYATKVVEGTIPDRPGVPSPPGESAHSVNRGDAVTGVHNCTWIFKWSASAESPTTAEYPTTFATTWNLLFLYSPGWYWYDGEAEDVWSLGGYSFWSETIGAYHCPDDAP